MTRPDRPPVGSEHSIYAHGEEIEMIPQAELEAYAAAPTAEPKIGRIALWRPASVHNDALAELPINTSNLGLSVVNRKDARFLFRASELTAEEIEEEIRGLKMDLELEHVYGRSPVDYRLSGNIKAVKILGQQNEAKRGVRRVSLLLQETSVPRILRNERRALIGAFDVPDFSRKERITPHITVFKTKNHQEAVEFAQQVQAALDTQGKTKVKLDKLNITQTNNSTRQPPLPKDTRFSYKP